MRIIKEGKIPEEQEIKATCRYCGTQFAFYRKEATYISDQRDGDYLDIQCPLCKKSVTASIVVPSQLTYDYFNK